MARYLVLEFDDDDQADKMVAKIEGVESATYRVAGMFQKPKQYCSCPQKDAYVKNEFGRGSKFGWWVHRTCRKPRKGGHQLTNLIKGSARRFRSPKGYDYVVSQLSIFDLPIQNIEKENSDG